MSEKPLTDHQRELVDDLQDNQYPDAYAYGYLRSAVKALLDGHMTTSRLRERLTDIEAAQNATKLR